MSFKLADRVLETTTTTSTGSVLLAGAVTQYLTFASALANGDTCYYLIVEPTFGEWELGFGTYNSGSNSLGRTRVILSTNGNAAVSLGSGTKYVSITRPSWALPDGVYGDGRDGDYVASSGTLTLTSDVYWKTCTLSGSAKIDTAGYRIFCSEHLDLRSAGTLAIFNSGNAGGSAGSSNSGGGSGGGKAAGSLGGSTSGTTGGAGGTTTGTQATAPTAADPGNGGNGGSGALGGTGPSGAGGALRAGATATTRRINRLAADLIFGVSLIGGGGAGAGGGGGGGDGTTAGGGGGGGASGGAVIGIWARLILRGASTGIACIIAVGGSGGAGGNGRGTGTGGRGGNGGDSGLVIIVSGKDGITEYTGTAGGAGGANSGITGGTAGTAGALTVNL